MRLLKRRYTLKRIRQMDEGDYHMLMAVITYATLWVAALVMRWGFGDYVISSVVLILLSGMTAGICAGLAYTAVLDHVTIESRDERVTNAILEQPEEQEEDL